MRRRKGNLDWKTFVASAPRCAVCGHPGAHEQWRYDHAANRGVTEALCGFCIGAFTNKAIWDRLHCVPRTATRLWRRGEYDHLVSRVGGGPLRTESPGAGATAGATLRDRVPRAS